MYYNVHVHYKIIPCNMIHVHVHVHVGRKEPRLLFSIFKQLLFEGSPTLYRLQIFYLERLLFIGVVTKQTSMRVHILYTITNELHVQRNTVHCKSLNRIPSFCFYLRQAFI